MNVNLKLLHIFLLVAEHGSFRQAAEQSHRSLPAISMQVRRLEEQLGVALFHRTTRRVQLTAEGEHLLAYARRALAEMETGLRHIRQTVDMQQGRISLSCVPTLAGTCLPGILADFNRSYPGIVLFVRELALIDLLESVRRQDVDFGIGPRPDERLQEFSFEPVMQDEICALLPASGPRQYRQGIGLEAFSRMPVLMISRQAGLRAMLDRTLREAGLDVQIRCEAMHVETLIAMARAGMGAALLPRISIPADVGPSLRVVSLKPPMARTVGIITLRGQALPPASLRLKERVAQTLGGRADAPA